MLKSLYTTATGMKAQQTMVDTIANNIANVNTTGFKSSTASFEDLLYVTLQAPGTGGSADSPNPVGLQVGSGTKLAATFKNYRAGTLEGTDRPLDIAITGDGFMQVIMQDGSTAYTRDGSLHINANSQLVTKSGLIIQPPITLPQDLNTLDISQDGRVTGTTASTPEVTTEFGQLTLHKFPNPSGLLAEGGNIVRETSASGPAVAGTAGENGFGAIQNRHLEKSNVEIVTELVQLIVAQRAYEVNSRAIQASDQMLQTASSVVR